MHRLHLGKKKPIKQAPLAGYEPLQTSARSNREVDDEEMRARFPVVIVLAATAFFFVVVSMRAGAIAASAGIAALALHRWLAEKR